MATTDEPAQQTDAGLPISQVQLERLTQWQSGNRYREQPSYAWSFPKAIDEAAVLSAWTGLVARYENLRTVFLDDAGSLRREQRPTDATTAGTFVTTGPERFFDRLLEPLRLLGGPLTRIVHARSERETLIGVCADHLVIDGATLQMMFTDLWTLLGERSPRARSRCRRTSSSARNCVPRGIPWWWNAISNTGAGPRTGAPTRRCCRD